MSPICDKKKKDQEYDKVEGAMVNKVMRNAMKQEEKAEEVTFIAIEFDKRRLDGTQEVLQAEIVGNEGMDVWDIMGNTIKMRLEPK